MLLAAFTASTALASPLLKVRQNNDDEDKTLFSPLNNTQITPGGTLNFTYRVDDDDARAVRVALVQILEVGRSRELSRLLQWILLTDLSNAPYRSPETCRPREALMATASSLQRSLSLPT